jgi:hypothetical protein
MPTMNFFGVKEQHCTYVLYVHCTVRTYTVRTRSQLILRTYSFIYLIPVMCLGAEGEGFVQG